jgi:hypothetical protein
MQVALLIFRIFGLALVALVSATASHAQIAPRFAIFDVQLGQPLSHIPQEEIVETACGTNGGPPGRPLVSLEEYTKCKPEASGLREVYFQYDDELEYWAKANELRVEAQLYAGTSVYAHPAIVSVLVDEAGIVQGIRIVTDPRAELRQRNLAVALRRFLLNRYGDGWDCMDRDPSGGETAFGGTYVNQACAIAGHEDGNLYLEAHYFRKKGQTQFNRSTREVNSSYFESSTRLEVMNPPFRSPGSSEIKG